MTKLAFSKRYNLVVKKYDDLLTKPNTLEPEEESDGVIYRYQNPVLTSHHIPIFWEYDLNPITNPFFMKRFGVNSVFNPGAIRVNGRYFLVARVEGYDRKSFFAVAESPNGVDNFRFHNKPIWIQTLDDGEVNIYDMRLTEHEDGWIYGVFCSESKDPDAPPGDETSAIARCGIVRTKDLEHWERLPNLKTKSNQQRNLVLHPELVEGKYAFYTRPQDGFIDSGSQGGIGFGLAERIEEPVIEIEKTIFPKKYHTCYEYKNGLGPAPLKTDLGWLHLAHGVRNTAAGLRYTLYTFMTAIDDPTKVIYVPGGYLLAPKGKERVGDVSNVLFSNGWVLDENDRILIYYASSDTRVHVAETSLDRMLDYVVNTPPDEGTYQHSLKRMLALIDGNLNYNEKNHHLLDSL